MIRRIRASAAKQDWFAVFVDLVIVMVGVFLGIQASNWNQDRQDRAQARELRAELVDNLRVNEADLAARSMYYQSVQSHAFAALAAVNGQRRTNDETFLIDAYQASEVWLRPFERSAFNGLQSSGLIQKIGDVRMRGAIADYAVTANGFDATGLGVSSYRDKLRRAMDVQVQEQIMRRCGDRMRPLAGRGQAPMLPESCKVDIDAADARRAAARVKAIPELDQELTRLIVDIDQKQALFSRMRRKASELRNMLDGS